MIKKYSSFINELDVTGAGEVTGTKPTALSEDFCNKMNECMEMAKMEAMQWNEDEDPKHTYESWMNECDSYVKEKLNEIKTMK